MNTESQHAYTGRFAPSPTGPLHMGSLTSAVASYLDAKAQGGRWLLRMEDIDPPREQPGAAEKILQSLQRHGLHHDGDILWQHQRSAAYDRALEQLLASGDAFYCSCSRRQLADVDGLHHGPCVAPLRPDDAAIRLRADSGYINFEDRLFGAQGSAQADFGDVILRRRDGYYAYQLAVVVDDAEQGISDVVRGTDLLSSTARQLLLQQKLGLARPRYLHIPVLLGADGHKLSKQAHAPAIDDNYPEANLRRALDYLGQSAPPPCRDIAELLQWACAHWRIERLPRHMGLPATISR